MPIIKRFLIGGDRSMKAMIKRIPVLGDIAGHIYWKLVTSKKRIKPFAGSGEYWKLRYSIGGNSGVGSYGKFAEFKAEVLNAFVATHDTRSIIEFGCGDGNQLRYVNFPNYLGFDISETVVSQCRNLFAADKTKSFRLMCEYAGEKADLVLSLDVIYHLVEDEVFEQYMRTLFGASDQYVIIYSSDSDDNRGFERTHVRHRNFTKWIQEKLPHWRLTEHIRNRYPYRGDYRHGSFADFFVYQKV